MSDRRTKADLRVSGEVPPRPTDAPVPAQDFEFTLGVVDAGWLPVTMAVEDQALDVEFSNVYCPFESLLQWLKDICEGKAASVTIDLEGNQIVLAAYSRGPAHDDGVHLAIWFLDVLSDEGQLRINCILDRRNLVATIYSAVRDYSESGRYDGSEWSVTTLRKEFRRRMPQITSERLARYPASKINTFLTMLFDVDAFDMYPTQRSKVQFEPLARTPRHPEIRRYLAGGTAPPDFDHWTTRDRLAFVEELFDHEFGIGGGFDLTSWQSNAVEEFLRV